nr:PEP-CTERM sorting domain-containing protein [Desulfobacula sp.]
MRKQVLCLFVFLMVIGLVTAASATTITQAFSHAFRDNEGASPVFTGQGDNFTVGVSLVVPDGNNGTTATATHEATGGTISLINLAYQMRPGSFVIETSFAEAQTNGWLSPSVITLTNGTDVATRTTPDRSSAQKMEFVKNLSIKGSGVSPTVTWEVPTTGPVVSRITYELWNNDTNQIVTGQSPVPLGASVVAVTLGNLEIGTNYAVRIMPEQRDAHGIVSRSSNWMAWEAKNGEAQGTVLELTTGSPAGASQLVDTPNETFKIEFDYRFTTTTGYLDVSLADISIGTRLEAPSSIGSEFFHAVFEVEAPEFFDLDNALLLFLLDGPTGSNILIDNINFPGLSNGDFEQGLDLWTEVGEGVIGTRTIPEPTTMLLFGLGLLGLAGVNRGKK